MTGVDEQINVLVSQIRGDVEVPKFVKDVNDLIALVRVELVQRMAFDDLETFRQQALAQIPSDRVMFIEGYVRGASASGNQQTQAQLRNAAIRLWDEDGYDPRR